MYLLELGGEDDEFAAAEARAAATDVTITAPGLATARSLVPDRVRTLAFTQCASVELGRATGGIDTAVALLDDASLDRSGTVAVRARDVRGTTTVDTQAAERALGAVLVERGFSVDLETPDHVLRAVFSDDLVGLGWEVAVSVRDYGPRRPTNRPFFQPGGMSPLLARALLNLALPTDPDRATVVDPMCGTGGLLIEAGLIGATAIGVDAQRRMVAGARRNLATYLDDGFAILQGDATTPPLRSGLADAVVMDVPYGRQSKIASHDQSDLVTGALAAAREVGSRAAVVTATAVTDAIDDTGWTLQDRFERRVHRSLVRHIHVLS